MEFVKEYKNDRKNFIMEFEYRINRMLINNEITKFSFKRYVSKIAFVPIFTEENKNYVTLAKHSRGKRKNQYSFIGGGTSDCDKNEWEYKTITQRANIVASALFDEVYEEFGIVLNWEYFGKALIDIKRAGDFLIFYVNITNITPEFWRNIQNEREKIENLRKRYLEISEIKNYDITFIQSEYERLKDKETNKIDFYINDEVIEVSRYVISMSRHIFEMSQKIIQNPNQYNINIDKFKIIPLKYIHRQV
jgi:hypothetical protein